MCATAAHRCSKLWRYAATSRPDTALGRLGAPPTLGVVRVENAETSIVAQGEATPVSPRVSTRGLSGLAPNTAMGG